MQLQKEVKSNPKQPSCKKKNVCGPQEGHCEKRCEIRKVTPKKWLDCRLMTKILITTFQINLVPNPMEKATKIHLNCRY